jgi:pullulanase
LLHYDPLAFKLKVVVMQTAIGSMFRGWAVRARGLAVMGLAAVMLQACGGGGGSPAPETAPPVQPPAADARLEYGNAAAFATVLSAAPVASAPGGGGGAATTLTLHYKRPAGDYTGWTVHTFNAAVETSWTTGLATTTQDAFGAVVNVPLKANSGSVGYIFHKGDEKDHGGADQAHVLKPGANEIWRIQGDNTTYTSNPAGAAAPDVTTVRVHYKRFGNDYANWGLHLWPTNGMDTTRVPAGLKLDTWAEPVAFSAMPGYASSNGELVFDIPVLNPKADANRKSLEFIIHGTPPNSDNKDGRSDNIKVDFAALTLRAQVGEVWLVQGDPTVYLAAPDTRSASTTDARAVWLNKQLIQWPRVTSAGVIKLYHSVAGQLLAPKDGKVSGADGSLLLDAYSGKVPPALVNRFQWVDAGAVLAVKDADLSRMGSLHKSQLLLVQEDASGNVQNATTVQNAGALDDLYAAAANVNDLGVSIGGSGVAIATTFKLWAPTAQKVLVFTYDTATGPATTVDEMVMDANTGVWAASRTGDLSGKTYRFTVDVLAKGVGLVRNLVTDPYSVSLTTDSKRSYIANLANANLKPAGWDASAIPNKVTAPTDMVVYELHVRDFSANDASVSAANRGKYLAFSEASSNGMKHLKALGDAGVTDVHLLPVYDIASVPEAGCTTPAPAGAADAQTQQTAVVSTASSDCFNWGYDPYHFNAPEGSYASDAADGAKRIIEFRQMVMGLHAAGLRAGMDVVYNHTSASGQNVKSVLDRIVPGYYHRLNADGTVANSSCCDNTATENLMMGKLVLDSTVLWAREYKIASFRFDLMGHMPRALLEQVKTKTAAATGREVQLFGEGWNFGEVANGARFPQASQGGLGGAGIGTFGDKMRDAVRGGSGFDSGNDLIKNQGFINGVFYDRNALAPDRPLNDLRYMGDLIKGGLAGSIGDFTLTTHWDATLQLKDLGGVGYATQPSEVVNYVENHDNQTLWDNNAYKLPLATPKEDRARVQLLGNAIVALSQGIAYFHAGTDTLRSKSLDRNSYDSGDWFNKLDWTYTDNNFGVGLPPQGDNGNSWSAMQPLLSNAALKPAAADIVWMRDAFRDLMKIRASTTLLKLRTADDIKTRLSFYNLGGNQVPTVLAAKVSGVLNGVAYAGANFKELAYFINVSPQAQTLNIAALANKGYVLHPVHASSAAADKRAAGAAYTAATGSFNVPARTAVVFVVN